MSGKAIIIGAGIAGLSAAIALRDAGWDVRVYEQAPKLEAIGAALSIWPNAVAALDAIGCGEAFRAVAPPIEEIGLALSNGKPMFNHRVEQAVPGQCGFLPSRTMLQRALAQRLGHEPLSLDHQLTGWRADADGVEVTFAGGHSAQGDLLIAADGIWSKIAADVIGTTPRHSGYGGVIALSDPVPTLPNQAKGTEFWGRGERMGLFDFEGSRKYWFYMRNEPNGPSAHELTHSEVLHAVEGWHPSIIAAVKATPEDRLIPFEVYAKSPPKRLGKGRVICVGDAAHAMEPNLGQGGCQGLEDAIALGCAAREGDPATILARFERMRLKRVRRFVSLSMQGGWVPHRFPFLMPVFSTQLASKLFTYTTSHRLRSLYQMPDYAAM